MAAKKTTKAKKEEVIPTEHVVTAEDMEKNPSLAEQGVEVGDVIEVEKPTKKAKVNMVVVTMLGGAHREFSLEIHGADFKEIAKEFATTNAKIVTGVGETSI